MGLDVVAVGGAPATGKSTLMHQVVDKTSEVKYNGNEFKWGEVVGTFYTNDGLVIYGKYDGSKEFEGTDVLSKSANNHAKQFTQMLVDMEKFNTILFEGDRLFNRPFLNMCREHGDINLQAFVLTADNEKLEARHDERGDDHSDKWKGGMRTQYKNYEQEPWTVVLENETEGQLDQNVEKISNAAGLVDTDVEIDGEDRVGSLSEF